MIDIAVVKRQFETIGARLVTAPARRRDRRRYSIDVTLDSRRREIFVLASDRGVELQVVNAVPARRHLLLLVKTERGRGGLEKHLYLCGHDERHWFVAAVPPGERGVTTVAAAMETLKPQDVREAQARQRLRAKNRQRRANTAFRRQGEWFFVPAPELKVEPSLVLRREPLSRGGKAHLLEEAYRHGGRTVYVCRRFPQGIPAAEYRRLLTTDPSARGWGWRVMRADAELFARGHVRHQDHATLYLPFWHRVLPNTEDAAPWRRQLVFLD